MALALLCVLAIALLQRQGLLEWPDEALMGWAGRLRDGAAGGSVTPLMWIVTKMGGTGNRLIVLALALGILFWRRQRERATWLLLTVAGGLLLNPILKHIFAAPRPDLLPHLDAVSSYSFPSGHAAGSMILLGALAMLAGRWPAYAAALFATVWIGVSRIWLGVHWPSDVMAGWIEGLGWLTLCRCWLPAGGGEQERLRHALMRGHPIGGDEAMDPETVHHAERGDRQ
ncbi:undecaprenyl-diphosphatase [Sphingobium faniae]|nr:undecaprenyl-diphosphatase [Sphingobium faniae]